MLNTLVIITPGFPKDVGDTSCVQPQQSFVKALKKVRPELNIIVLALQYPFISSKYQWHSVQVIALGGKEKGGMYRRFNWIKAYLILKQLKKKYQTFGILSFWLGECAFIADRFAKKHHLIHYAWILGQDAKADNKYVRWIKPKSVSLISLSDFIVKEFASNYQVTPAHIIPVGIDPNLFEPGRRDRDIDVIGAGSLIPLKQYDVFVSVIAALKKLFPHIKAVLCGTGPEKNGIEEKINHLGLNDTITLLGELPHEDVLILMQRSKIFLHTSNYEGFGAVNLEALYAGAKVISFVKPMETAIADWHIANDTTDMYQMAARMLNDQHANYQPRMIFPIENNALKMLDLFDHKEAAI